MDEWPPSSAAVNSTETNPFSAIPNERNGGRHAGDTALRQNRTPFIDDGFDAGIARPDDLRDDTGAFGSASLLVCAERE
jgi:hypothetical protein